MKHGIQGLDARHLHIGFLCKLHGRPKIRFHLHWSPGLKVLPHYALGDCLPRHFIHGFLFEVHIKFTAMSGSQLQELVNHTGDKRSHGRLGKKLRVAC